MATGNVRAEYEVLAETAGQFSREADRIRQVTQQLGRGEETLHQGQWVGQGALAFYHEMDASVLPAFRRLENALQTSGDTVKTVSGIFQKAEQEAAGYLKLGGGGSAGTGAGNTGLAGGAPAMGTGAPGTGIGAGAGSSGGAARPSLANLIANHFELKPMGEILSLGLEKNLGGKSFKSYKEVNPVIGVQYGVEKAFFGDPKAPTGWAALGAEGGVGAGVGRHGVTVGAYGSVYAFKAQGETIVTGDQQLGMTAAGEVKAMAVEGFAGIKDNSLGASIGAKLVTVKGEVGANVAGYNVGVNAEVGLKAELGVQVGAETKVKLPFVTLGLSFGKAKG